MTPPDRIKEIMKRENLTIEEYVKSYWNSWYGFDPWGCACRMSMLFTSRRPAEEKRRKSNDLHR